VTKQSLLGGESRLPLGAEVDNTEGICASTRTRFGPTHRTQLCEWFRRRGCIDLARLLVALTCVGHIHLMHESSMSYDARICVGGIGLGSEKEASRISRTLFS
jgi:hypothetical protein